MSNESPLREGALFSFSNDGVCLVVIDSIGLDRAARIDFSVDSDRVQAKQAGRLFLDVQTSSDTLAKFKASPQVALIEAEPGETPDDDLFVKHTNTLKDDSCSVLPS